jgi:DNA-binding winged helix-turn-helix (wHTH) protein/TolB-like protein
VSAPSTKLFYEFGQFRLDVAKHRLLRNGEIVSLTPKAVETLRVLVERPGRLVERDELMGFVWRDATVESGNLDVTISKLRKTLGKDGDGRKYIETVPRLGYQFVAEVREVVEEVPALMVEKQTLARMVIEEEIRWGRKSRSASESRLRLSSRQRLLAAIVAAAAVVVAIGAFAFRPWGANPASAATQNIRSVAVLPFKTIEAEREDSHKGLGLADILITRLSNIRELSVRPTSAVIGFENHQGDSVSFGRQLQVDAVLEGSIYQVNERVRVTARLVRVSDQSTIWASQFEKPVQDELKLQDEIALQLVDALAITLSGNEKTALTRRYTESADAYQLYVRGRYHWNKRNFEGLSEAQRLFRNAIEKDPKFTLAYVGLADSMVFFYEIGEVNVLLAKALELDPNLAEAYATRGFVETVHGWEWQAAEASFRKSIELNPGYATAHHWYAILLGIEGRNDEAKAELRRALEIDPLSHNFLADLGQVHYFAREYDQAKMFCQRALALYPDFPHAHAYLYDVYLKTGEYDAAIDELVKSQSALFTFAVQTANEKEGLMRYDAAQRERYRGVGIRKFLLEVALGKISGDASLPYGRARVYAFLGEKEKALDNLEEAHTAHAFMMAWVRADPGFDNLRAEPRYQAILKSMGLL